MGLCLLLVSAALLVLHVNAASRKVSSPRTTSLGPVGRLQAPPPPAVSRASTAETLWFEQTLDHFDSTNNATWQQRYFRNTAYYKDGGPVMLFISGEAEAGDGWVVGGNMVTIASWLGGLCLEIEHRYYGQSRPTPDLSTENLQYLSAPQALADIANFIRQYKADNPSVAAAKWVVFGASYAGNLAAWARLEYPDLITAAVASSAPVQANLTFPEYYEQVGEVVGDSDPECLQDIQSAVQEFEDLVQTQAGADNVSQYYSLCDKLNICHKLDVALVEDEVENLFSGLVQSDSATVPDDVRQRCALVRNQTGTPLQRMAATSLQKANVNLGSGCLNAKFSGITSGLKRTAYGNDRRQWTYQTCTEFGYFFTMDSDKQPFGNLLTVDYSEKICKDIFGEEFDLQRTQRGVDATNARYGGRTPDVTNVVFVNGGMDPWHRLSVLEDLSPTTVAVVIPDTAHCTDSLADKPDDSQTLKNGRFRIRVLVAQWLGYQVEGR